MSSPALNDLLDALGFDGSPLEIDLRAFHVPYDDRGRSGIESGIADAARRCERIAVSAPIGAGKTSAIRYALDDADNGLAPIWVSVSRDTEDVVTEPKAFLAHLVQSADRHAAKASLLSDAEREAILRAATDRVPLPTRARRLSGRVSAKFWIARADVARDVTTTLAGGDLNRPLAELRDSAQAVLEAIAAHGLQPVLVVDDADHFTRRDPRAQHAVRVGAFFGPVLAEASKLPCGMVVAVHDGYESMTAFRKARADFGVLQRTIAVPEIVSGQLTRILERRIHATIGAGVEQIITPEAIDALAEINRGPAKRNLRTVLSIAHQALTDAIGGDRELIDADEVRAAAPKHLG